MGPSGFTFFQAQPSTKWTERWTSGGRVPPPRPGKSRVVLPASCAYNTVEYPREEQ